MDTMFDGEATRMAHAGITVPLYSLRRALVSVKPHVAGPKSVRQELMRLRIMPGPDRCLLLAGDTFSIACASVRVHEVTTGRMDPIDLDLEQVAKILAVFKMPTDRDTWASLLVRLEVDDGGTELRVVDASGMFDGYSLSLPLSASSEKFPNIPRLLATLVSGATAHFAAISSGQYDRGVPLSAWTKLQAAAKAYEEPVYVGPGAP